jgi:hypothetical protein
MISLYVLITLLLTWVFKHNIFYYVTLAITTYELISVAGLVPALWLVASGIYLVEVIGLWQLLFFVLLPVSYFFRDRIAARVVYLYKNAPGYACAAAYHISLEASRIKTLPTVQQYREHLTPYTLIVWKSTPVRMVRRATRRARADATTILAFVLASQLYIDVRTEALSHLTGAKAAVAARIWDMEWWRQTYTALLTQFVIANAQVEQLSTRYITEPYLRYGGEDAEHGLQQYRQLREKSWQAYNVLRSSISTAVSVASSAKSQLDGALPLLSMGGGMMSSLMSPAMLGMMTGGNGSAGNMGDMMSLLGSLGGMGDPSALMALMGGSSSGSARLSAAEVENDNLQDMMRGLLDEPSASSDDAMDTPNSSTTHENVDSATSQPGVEEESMTRPSEESASSSSTPKIAPVLSAAKRASEARKAKKRAKAAKIAGEKPSSVLSGANQPSTRREHLGDDEKAAMRTLFNGMLKQTQPGVNLANMPVSVKKDLQDKMKAMARRMGVDPGKSAGLLDLLTQ